MDKNKIIKTAATVVAVICIALSLILCAKCLFSSGGEQIAVTRLVMTALLILALLFALVYFLGGGKKSDARSFKLFTVLYTVALAGCAVNSAYAYFVTKAYSPIALVLTILGMFFVATLAVGKNLGKLLSHTLCGLNFVNSAFVFFTLLVSKALGHITEELKNIMPFELLFAALTLSVVMWLLVYFKYVDKDERGTY